LAKISEEFVVKFEKINSKRNLLSTYKEKLNSNNEENNVSSINRVRHNETEVIPLLPMSLLSINDERFKRSKTQSLNDLTQLKKSNNKPDQVEIKKKKFKKIQIGHPTDFKHLNHVGFSNTGIFDVIKIFFTEQNLNKKVILCF
jgi:hypothetical protein